ncbi:MAG TPA: hypothetical protein VGU65_10405 [Frateuria sp.]|uniref:hypothetical protein n=1 Tax=Frateuria sp. TaxID=2211372 RepID=UPI002DF27458|nr:hypothetical protein [Frateuria sp.]
MPRTLSVLLQNEADTPLRVAGLFATRSCDIDALSVCATDDPAFRRSHGWCWKCAATPAG